MEISNINQHAELQKQLFNHFALFDSRLETLKSITGEQIHSLKSESSNFETLKNT